MEIANIWKPFMPKAAARIGNIPKVFFIDACRGDREMHLEAVMVPKSGGAHVQSSVDAVHQKGGTVKVHLEMPPEGNYLIAYATTENYKSYEVKNEGGIWLRALSDKICEKAATESVTNILTEVNKVLAKTYQNSAYREALTQPDFNCKLQDTLYLVPKAHGASVPTPPGLKQRCLSQEGIYTVVVVCTIICIHRKMRIYYIVRLSIYDKFTRMCSTCVCFTDYTSHCKLKLAFLLVQVVFHQNLVKTTNHS